MRPHDEHELAALEAIAPERRRLLVCECGKVATGFANSRCGRDLRTNMRVGCPVEWQTFERVDEVGA